MLATVQNPLGVVQEEHPAQKVRRDDGVESNQRQHRRGEEHVFGPPAWGNFEVSLDLRQEGERDLIPEPCAGPLGALLDQVPLEGLVDDEPVEHCNGQR